MTRSVVIAVLACWPTWALAQGVNQTTRTPTTVNQQRLNGAIVQPGFVTQTAPPPNTFRSPFTSPFGTSTPTNDVRSGYAGSGPR